MTWGALTAAEAADYHLGLAVHQDPAAAAAAVFFWQHAQSLPPGLELQKLGQRRDLGWVLAPYQSQN